MASIRFIQCREKKKGHTYLVSLDCSRICAILYIFEVVKATFRLCSFFSSLSYDLHTVSQKRFSLPSLAQSTIIPKTFSKPCESLVEMTRDGNCCEDQFFQFRHYQVVKTSFCIGFSICLLCKHLLLNVFRGLHLPNPK